MRTAIRHKEHYMMDLRNAWAEIATKDGERSVTLWLDGFNSRESMMRSAREELGLAEDDGVSFVGTVGVPECFVGEDGCVTDDFFRMMGYLCENLSGEDIDVLHEWMEKTGNDNGWEDWEALVAEYQSRECGMYESEEDFAYNDFQEYFGVGEDAMPYVDVRKWADTIFAERYRFISHHVFEV